MMKRVKVLDHVVLLRDHGQWIAGTFGTVVEAFDYAAYIELVGPDGKMLDIVTVPYEDLQVLGKDDHQVAV
jgi:hypothetical protein